MSFSPRNERMARSIPAAAPLRQRRTSPNASWAPSVQCQVSLNASICAALAEPSGALDN